MMAVKRLCSIAMFTAISWSIVAIVAVFSVSTAESATTYDLKTQFSTSSNPNGVWTYREGANALPGVTNWTQFGGSVSQPAWAPGATAPFLPAWLQSTSVPTGFDLVTGDIVVHTTDPGNGSGKGPANVIWTSPSAGTIDISGNVWMVREINRSNTWALLLNGVAFTSGAISSGDAFNRASPFDFAAGSGGIGAVTALAVQPGDTIWLQIVRTSSAGDFVGTNLTIELSAVPLPAALPLFLAALSGLGFFGWRRRRGEDVAAIAA